MTLPKGYKLPSSNNNNNNYRPTGRPRKKLGAKFYVFFVLFLISLILLIGAIINVMESGKALDDQKKVVAKSKIEYDKAFKDVHGRYPYPSEYPH